MPRSSRDAHRPLLVHEKLRDICQWREKRKVSKQLTLNYQRTLYVLEPGDAAREARGKRVDVYEDEDGNIEIRRGAVVLPAKAFQKEPRVASGAVVENKLLGAALQHIRQEQIRREEERLRSARLSKREKRLLEKKLRQRAPTSTPTAAE